MLIKAIALRHIHLSHNLYPALSGNLHPANTKVNSWALSSRNKACKAGYWSGGCVGGWYVGGCVRGGDCSDLVVVGSLWGMSERGIRYLVMWVVLWLYL